MVKPSFLSSSESRPSYTRTYRLVALGIIIAAGLVLALGFGFQGSVSPIGRLVTKVGKSVGFSVGDPTPVNSVAGTNTTDGSSSSGQTGQGAELAGVSSDEILRLINEYRRGKGLPEIVKNDRFCEFANARAKAASENWSQAAITENKDYIFRAVCLKCKKMAEILARNVTNPQSVLDEWLNSDKERTTLEHPYNIGCVGGFSPDQQTAYIAFELGEKVE